MDLSHGQSRYLTRIIRKDGDLALSGIIRANNNGVLFLRVANVSFPVSWAGLSVLSVF